METTLFTRLGFEYDKQYPLQHDSKGKPFYSYVAKCGRCGGLGGGSQWAFTGWTCYECGGSGKGSLRIVKLYNQEQIDKLNATAAKIQARKVAAQAVKDAAAQAARDARNVAFVAENGEYLSKVRAICAADAFAVEVLDTVERNARMSDGQKAIFDKAIANAERAAASSFIGTIGERREFTGELITVYALPVYNTMYAPRYLNVIRTAEGPVKYVGSSNLGSKGETVTFKATISNHEEYKGEKQTILERPKLSPKPVIDVPHQ